MAKEKKFHHSVMFIRVKHNYLYFNFLIKVFSFTVLKNTELYFGVCHQQLWTQVQLL